tara:strand:- start:6662 stop:6928 length:267 start_codon:yes stop_codon:yes gene_type:complete
MPNSSTIAIVSGQQAGASWGTGAAYVIVAKAHRAAVEAIDVRCFNRAVAVASEVAIALVIGEDKDNIGSRVRCHGLLSGKWGKCASGK